MIIINALKRIKKAGFLYFTTPGHCHGKFISKPIKKLIGKHIFKADFSENLGLDNLQNPSGIILESEKSLSDIYGTKHSFFLINGSTSGIIALMLSVLKEKDKVIISRNAHKSVINGLILTGAKPLWVNPHFNNEFGVPENYNFDEIEDLILSNTDIKAVIITNPTYEGIVSDLTPLAQLCKEKNIFLIVDEAHGALWNFSEKLPYPAVLSGADASVQSLHKTAGSLNQCALLHIAKDSMINPDKVRANSNLINTTSPSYTMLASSEASVHFLNSEKGRKRLNKILLEIDRFKEKLSKTGKIEFLNEDPDYKIDPTKIFFSIKDLSGYKTAEILENKHKIECELENKKGVLALTGIGTNKKMLKKLQKALLKIIKSGITDTPYSHISATGIEPEIKLTPKEAFFSKGCYVNIEEAVGKICKDIIAPCPPGVIILAPGEVIQKEHLTVLSDINKIQVISNF